MAIKTYPPNSSVGHDDLHKEGEVLAGLGYHPSIINLLGVSVDLQHDNRLLLLIDICEKGQLLDFLRRKQEGFEQKGNRWSEEFNPEVMALWSWQVK